VRDDRVRVEPRLHCDQPGCPLRSAIVAPLIVQDRRIGALVALYGRPGRLRLEETRAVGEAAALVSAMVELSEMEAQGERLARAELRALRAQISPHFIYNALAAVASFIHSRPEEARELLTEFAEFIRYTFARQRAYVTVADELRYVEKYLRLEQARFGGAGLGLVAGAAAATGAIFGGLAIDDSHPIVEALLTQPAVISVPLAFAVMCSSRCVQMPPARPPTRSCSPCTRPRGSASTNRSPGNALPRRIRPHAGPGRARARVPVRRRAAAVRGAIGALLEAAPAETVAA
jgi:Histidine kinase